MESGLLENYENEETDFKQDYLSQNRNRPKSIFEQLKILRDIFPELYSANTSMADTPHPPEAEGWFVIPPWKKIANNYVGALRVILQKIRTRTGGPHFLNSFEGLIDSCGDANIDLQPTQQTVQFWDKIKEKQKRWDFLIIPAQRGLRHKGRSPRRACRVMNSSEFGLDAFSVGVTLLTHPGRLSNPQDLHIHCIGDEYNEWPRCDDSKFDHTPSFYAQAMSGNIALSIHPLNEADHLGGSATGFLM